MINTLMPFIEKPSLQPVSDQQLIVPPVKLQLNPKKACIFKVLRPPGSQKNTVQVSDLEVINSSENMKKKIKLSCEDVKEINIATTPTLSQSKKNYIRKTRPAKLEVIDVEDEAQKIYFLKYLQDLSKILQQRIKRTSNIKLEDWILGTPEGLKYFEKFIAFGELDQNGYYKENLEKSKEVINQERLALKSSLRNKNLHNPKFDAAILVGSDEEFQREKELKRLANLTEVKENEIIELD